MPDNQDWQSQPSNELSAEEMRFAPNHQDADDNETTDDTHVEVNDSVSVERTFEELTLAELVGQFFKSPRRTSRALTTVTRASRASNETLATPIPTPITQGMTPLTVDTDFESQTEQTWRDRALTVFTTKLNVKQVQLVLYLIALVIGLVGSSTLLGPPDVRRSESNALVVGAPFLWLAFFIWIGAEIYGNWQSLVSWWKGRDRITQVKWVLRIIPLFVWLTALLLFTDSMTAPAELTLGLVQIAIGRMLIGLLLWVMIEVGIWGVRAITHQNRRQSRKSKDEPMIHAIRPVLMSRTILFVTASLSSILVWLGTPNNRIPPPIILLWFISAGLWAMVFAPVKWSIFDWATAKIDTFRRIEWRSNVWVIIVFALILVLGTGFRFGQLDSLPQEMTSDHVEKILDSNRVYNGEYNIFFANNGGREPIQMYLMSLFTNIPGLDFNHFTLKLLAAIQSMITLPILVWMGMELMGERNRRFGLIVGLLLAGMVAASYWHVAISRQALRIVMTPIFTALLLIYLARMMRYNRRSDYIKGALILGFGLYAYQAVRMLPVVVVVGIFIAVVVRSISWRERLKYGINLGVLVFISFMVFLPLFHYSLEDPDHFWRRTAGRILGDDVITEQRADGTIIERNPTPEEQVAAFNANVPILMTNIRNALLMYNWKGDVGWISGVPNEPAMDIYTGTFLILGLAGWLVMMVRSRDPVIWLIPIMIFIMLLPSALSIAYTIENPSHTRTSGSIPPAYLLVAFSMGIIVWRFLENFSRRTGVMLAIVFCGGILLLANHRNTSLYFDRYPPIYIDSSYPYSEAGSILRGFAESDGAYGNAFMIAYPHWWGHRAIGIAAGEPFWPNGIVNLNDVPNFMRIARSRSDQFKLDAEKDLLFFYSPDDDATALRLKEWFPDGREQAIQSYHPDDAYMLYRVPFLGDENLQEFITDNN